MSLLSSAIPETIFANWFGSCDNSSSYCMQTQNTFGSKTPQYGSPCQGDVGDPDNTYYRLNFHFGLTSSTDHNAPRCSLPWANAAYCCDPNPACYLQLSGGSSGYEGECQNSNFCTPQYVNGSTTQRGYCSDKNKPYCCTSSAVASPTPGGQCSNSSGQVGTCNYTSSCPNGIVPNASCGIIGMLCCKATSNSPTPKDTNTPTPDQGGGPGPGGGPTPTPTPIAKCAEGVGSPLNGAGDPFDDPGGPQVFCVVPTCDSTKQTCSAKITWAERGRTTDSQYRIVIAPARPVGSDQGGYEYFTIGAPPQTITDFKMGTTYTLKIASLSNGINKTGNGPGYGTPYWNFTAESAISSPTVTPTASPTPQGPTASPTPTGGTGEPGIVTVMLKLDSIDAQDQKIQRSPKHNSRKVTIFLYKNSNFNNDPFGARADYKITGNVFFTKGDSTKPQTYGLFVGKTSNGNFDFKKVVTGDYYVFVKTEATLREPLEDSPQQTRIDISNGMILDFSQDSSRSLPTGELIGADNTLTIDDFNAIVTCYNFPNNKDKVTDCQNLPGVFDSIFSQTPMVDLNDDGSIDGIDLNIFLRNYRNNSTGF